MHLSVKVKGLSLRVIGSTMFGATFNLDLVTCVGLSYFGTLRVGSLQNIITIVLAAGTFSKNAKMPCLFLTVCLFVVVYKSLKFV